MPARTPQEREAFEVVATRVRKNTCRGKASTVEYVKLEANQVAGKVEKPLRENHKGALIDFDAVKAYHQERDARRRAARESERRAWLERVQAAILRLAPRHPQIHRVYLFGSLVQPGRFGSRSDIDVAVVCDTPEAESAFWAALERDLRRDVDLRPLAGPLAETVALTGKLVYTR